MINDKTYRAVSVITATISWSLWTFHVNHGPLNSRLISAVCQGLISGTATSFMLDALKWLQKYFTNFLFPPVIVTAFTALTALFIHILIGTSEIAFTLIPSIIVALIFSLYTSFTQFKNSERESV